MENRIYIFELKGQNRSQLSKKAYSLVLKAAEKEFCPTSVVYKQNGKPYLKDLPDFHFNISHSDELLAVALSKTEVGVDIERHRDVNPRIAERYFSPREKEYVKTHSDFFYIWTRKEAYLKKSGVGIRKRLNSFCVLDKPNIKTYLFDGFTLSVCSDEATEFKILANCCEI